MGRVEHWSRLASKTHLAQLSPADVELIFETLGGYPSVTGQVASIMNTHAEDAMSQDPSGLELYLSPLFTRLREPETFKWLLDLHASEHKKCVLANALQEENCALFRKEIGDVFLKLVQLLNHFHLNRGVVDFDDAFMEVVVSHTKDIVEMMKRVEDNISDSQPPSRADMVLEMLTAATKRAISSSYGSLMGVNHRVLEGEGLTTADVDLLFDRLENVPVLRLKASAVIYSHQSNVLRAGGGSPLDLLDMGIFADDPLFSRLLERETFNWLLDIAADEKSRCVGSKIETRDDCVGFLWNLAQLFEVVAGTSLTMVMRAEKILSPKEIREAVELSSLVYSRGDEILALAQFMHDTIKEEDIAREGSIFKKTITTQVKNLRRILSLYAEELVDADATVSKGPQYDLMPMIVTAVLAVAVVAIGVWKSRAPAHERAARELLDDLAPSARTRRGRVVPVWATLLRVAACCTALVYSVLLVNNPDRGGMTSLAYALVFVSLCRTGVMTISERFAPEGSIWGRVGADALTLLQLMVGDTELGSTFYTGRACLGFSLFLLGMGRLAYDGVGWLRRLVQNSGPGAGRAPKADERPSTGAPASQQRGARPGLRKRANRGRRRDATPRAPEPDPPETQSETAAPQPKAPEPEPEPEPTHAADVQETVLEPTAPEPKVTEPEPTPAPVAEPRAPSAAPVPESKVEEEPVVAPPPAALEAKLEEPLLATDEPAAAPEGFEIVARVLEHLNEPHLLPIFVAEEINDNVLPCLDPSDLIGLGVSQMTCLTILGAAHSAAKNKKLETEDVLDNVAKHQSVLEEALREHREEIKRLRIRELPEDLMCPITCEIMKDPVLCVEDGHTYERVAVEQWFATGARTSPATSAQLESTALAPNHMARKLIAALLEEHRA